MIREEVLPISSMKFSAALHERRFGQDGTEEIL
jgi:hypothetical protein